MWAYWSFAAATTYAQRMSVIYAIMKRHWKQQSTNSKKFALRPISNSRWFLQYQSRTGIRLFDLVISIVCLMYTYVSLSDVSPANKQCIRLELFEVELFERPWTTDDTYLTHVCMHIRDVSTSNLWREMRDRLQWVSWLLAKWAELMQLKTFWTHDERTETHPKGSVRWKLYRK